jgi:hypothetical protein
MWSFSFLLLDSSRQNTCWAAAVWLIGDVAYLGFYLLSPINASAGRLNTPHEAGWPRMKGILCQGFRARSQAVSKGEGSRTQACRS